MPVLDKLTNISEEDILLCLKVLSAIPPDSQLNSKYGSIIRSGDNTYILDVTDASSASIIVTPKPSDIFGS